MNNSRALYATVLSLFLPPTEALAERTFTDRQTTGSYAYSFQGKVAGDSGAAIAATGLMNFHWQGSDPLSDAGIISEVDADGSRTIVIGEELCTNDFECDLTMESNGTGSAVCVPLTPDPEDCLPPFETFDFVLEDNSRGFRFLGTTPGLVVLGSGRRQ